ncbi:ZnF C2H2 [Geosmithia morbida]|uniref:ZnF C2H2 n=1 Tax=Geosmithia morbida TaxID=1094350 RepID=A0A9P4Z226_9HYPO|nr:ZnF C2H2 [Geosmithia morbida]KAF4125996.1 ZnF C2H2 [Geosmithia morbida]
MEPSTKRRKLAPKVVSPADPKSQTTQDTTSRYAVPQTSHPERHDFESFARHLQDAAMLIQRQAEAPHYRHVDVLMLTWEDGSTAPPDADLTALEKLLHTVYRYRTQRWQIPSCPNPSVKLGAKIASFLENAAPDHLLILYYAGRSFVGIDGQLYWASNEGEESAKLKWDGVRCLFEDAQPDMLILLDTCAVPHPVPSGSNGVKQAIAACASGPDVQPGASPHFTSNLVESLQKLAPSSPFSVQRLYEEMLFLHQQQLRQLPPPSPPSSGPNGNDTKPPSLPPPEPILITVTPGQAHTLALSPTLPRPLELPSPCNGGDPAHHVSPATPEERYFEPGALADIKFGETRILVCTTFVGDASADMSYFHHWLQNTPSLGSKISVEGIFIGPPTMLLISMPHSIWNVVQHDKVCCFLGYINSHNMLHLYQGLTGPTGPKPSAQQAEEGRALLEAREAAAAAAAAAVAVTATASVTQIQQSSHELDQRDVTQLAPGSREGPGPGSGPLVHDSPSIRPHFLPASPGPRPAKAKDEHEGSAEMREAAEQLKALSHVRHQSDEGQPPSTIGRPRTSLPNGMLNPDTSSPRAGHEMAIDEPTTSSLSATSPSRVKVPRHALPKHETRCNHCTHAPFRDSSSLRKHIAAAHTRPFPCAFSFAGCGSTFGSKNEWKRHITSQHLCLQYYRCSECPQATIEGKGNEFNRKDLFTQHLRRMHAPLEIKRPGSKDAKVQEEWEYKVRLMQESCLVTRRKPPQRCACPKPECLHVFDGPSAWDEWTEHVGRHMEKGEAANLTVDQYLVDWAQEETIIEPRPDGGHRLNYGSGSGNNSTTQLHNLNAATIAAAAAAAAAPAATATSPKPASTGNDVTASPNSFKPTTPANYLSAVDAAKAASAAVANESSSGSQDTASNSVVESKESEASNPPSFTEPSQTTAQEAAPVTTEMEIDK